MILFAIVGVITLMIANSILNGLALSILWGWFLVPVLDFPAIGITQAIGVGLVVSFLTHQYDEYKDKSKTFKEKLIDSLSVAISRPLMALAFGWIVKLFL